MKKKDNLIKFLFLLVAVNVWGVVTQFISAPKPVAAQTQPNQQTSSIKQYAWGMKKVTAIPRTLEEERKNLVLALSPDVANGETYSYQLTVAQVDQMTDSAAKKGWRVHTVSPINSGYFVLYEK